MKIAVVIPAFNEEASIAAVVEEVRKSAAAAHLDAGIIVVNDGSTDATAARAAHVPCILLNCPYNLGIGGAVSLGLSYAYQNGYEIAIQVDADGQHPPSEIPALIEPILLGRADVVIGSRFLSNVGYQSTLLRRLGIAYLNALLRWLTGVRVADSTSGFRAFNRNAVAFIKDIYPDDFPETVSNVMFARNHFRIAEVQVHMSQRTGGRSSIRGAKAVYYVLKVTLGIVFAFIGMKYRGDRHDTITAV